MNWRKRFKHTVDSSFHVNGFYIFLNIYFILKHHPPWDTWNVTPGQGANWARLSSSFALFILLIRQRSLKCIFLKKPICRLSATLGLLLEKRNATLWYVLVCNRYSHSVTAHGPTSNWPNINDIVVGARVYRMSAVYKALWHRLTNRERSIHTH